MDLDLCWIWSPYVKLLTLYWPYVTYILLETLASIIFKGKTDKKNHILAVEY